MRYQIYRGPKLTPLWVIIGVNILLYFVTLIGPQLRLLFGLMPALILDRPWTIVTSMFIHAGLWHVMANMFTLFFFGQNLISLVGENRFLAVYFTGGILGGILYVLLASPFSVAVGASGAVFAIGGALAMLRPKTKVIIFPIPAPIPLWAAIGGGFLVLSFFPGIAWQAHLGGMIVGLIAGYIFRRRERFYH
ncbi:rhomboid family intramembrane serine protease [Chloroflexota bacterium]